VREKAASSVVTSLRDRNGNLTTDHVGLQTVCVDFYKNLYTVTETST
jgi:hypothetical protein